MACAMNVITAYLGNGTVITTAPLYQYDYGQLLRFSGVELPDYIQVHFSNEQKRGTATTSIATNGVVQIPNSYLTTGKPVYAWIFLHDAETDGETEYAITIPVIQRSKPTEEEPTPDERSEINQLLAALNAGVSRSEAAADNSEASAKESAESALESAASASEAVEQAAQSAQYALTSAASAEESAQYAQAAALSAEQSAQSANESADSATAAAERVEEAQMYARDAAASAERAAASAANAGYMYFAIDERGHLIFQRTNNVDAEFFLYNGHLYVGVNDG